jgi:hypothetical protein
MSTSTENVDIKFKVLEATKPKDLNRIANRISTA